MTARTSLSSWQALVEHAKEMKQQHMNDLFAADKHRFDKFSIKLPAFLLDYSKNLITEDTFSKLITLAKDCDLEGWRAKMLKGDHINRTEDRAVLHTALRNRSKTPMILHR